MSKSDLSDILSSFIGRNRINLHSLRNVLDATSSKKKNGRVFEK
jgi:hypothetical protein